MYPLSAGVCAWLNQAPLDEIDELDSGYAVQLLSIRKIKQTTRTAQTQDRYHVVISDGVHWVRAVLSTHLNDLVCLGDVAKFTVVVIDTVTCTILRDIRSGSPFSNLMMEC